MLVLSHRGNWDGIRKADENTIRSVRFCLERGWGIEIDIRRAPTGAFYISHEPAEWNKENRAEAFFELIRQYPEMPVALNVKELGYEAELANFLVEQRVTRQTFLFDMEFLETSLGQTAEVFRQLDHRMRVAARASDRKEPADRALSIKAADMIWMDEFDRLWITEAVIRKLKSAGRVVYGISPEIHGFTLNDMKRRWREFYVWGVDGVCTDYAAVS